MLLLLAVLNLDYIRPLAEDPRGRWMALAGLTSIAMGILLMTRMGRIDV